jgi:AbiV family abortive infection protein
MGVKPRVLLEGAWYAMEQSGLLVRASVTLFDAEQYAPAAGLALLVHEELGRHHILVDLWWNAEVKRADLTVENIKHAYGDHVEKQRRGLHGVSLRFGPGSVVIDLFRKMVGGPRSPDYAAARQELDEVLKSLAKRAPNQRDRARINALYVDLEDSGGGWKRPADIGRDRVLDIITEACGHYSDYHSAMGIWLGSEQENPTHPQDEALLAWVQAVKAWPQRPEWPVPTWPKQML